MLALTVVFGSDLEALVGRLGNAAMILIQMRHFTNRIRYLSIVCQRGRGRKIKLTENVKEDLKLCLEFLEDARDGISMNLLTFRKPTHFFRSDA